MAEKRCLSCAGMIPVDDAFCRYCGGGSFGAEKQATRPPEQESRPVAFVKAFGTLGLGALIFSSIVGSLFGDTAGQVVGALCAFVIVVFFLMSIGYTS